MTNEEASDVLMADPEFQRRIRAVSWKCPKCSAVTWIVILLSACIVYLMIMYYLLIVKNAELWEHLEACNFRENKLRTYIINARKNYSAT